ncbi:hypothetical protein TNCV_1352721 [Trichonephila clavipes]|nr:hypothetical protein TNCV_1352721 [Trichonephila clavipes]
MCSLVVRALDSRPEGLGQITSAHGSSNVTTGSSQSAASFLEGLSQNPTVKTTCGNHGRRKNIARELTIAEGLASTKKRVVKGNHREGIGAKHRATASASKHNASCICLVCGANIMRKIKNKNWCNVVIFVHPGSMRSVSS